MDESILNPEIIKRCNPGMTDFGSGNILALTSQCLRNAKQPSDCQVCAEACPLDAIKIEMMHRPNVSTDCIKCGYCVSICPLNALAATTRTIQQVIRLLLQATLRVDQLTITCQRTYALLRLESESSDPQYALDQLALLDQAQATENLFVLPCLAMLTPELWFLVLNEIGVSRIQELDVLLPLEQCLLCPVNSKGHVEDDFADAIDTAERWSGQVVNIICEAKEIPQYHKADIRQYLASDQEVNRRGIFSGFVKELKLTLDETTRTGNRAADETIKNRARRDTINRTVLAEGSRAPTSGPDQPLIVPVRQALIEAIGRNPANAGRIRLMVSESDPLLCDGCGNCVQVCPLHARQLIDGKAYADSLYCLGCSACIQECPQSACQFKQISGKTFLLHN